MSTIDPNGVPAPGMTLRDWFAGQAVAGLLSCPATPAPDGKTGDLSADAFAYCAYQVADAMLAARDKRSSDPWKETDT